MSKYFRIAWRESSSMIGCARFVPIMSDLSPSISDVFKSISSETESPILPMARIIALSR